MARRTLQRLDSSSGAGLTGLKRRLKLTKLVALRSVVERVATASRTMGYMRASSKEQWEKIRARDIPESMKAELQAWNNGAGIDLESWVGCSGNFSLAVGYATIFWPELTRFEGYILRKGFSEPALRGFEQCEGATRKSVEWVMNHLHIADIQHAGCEDITQDKLVALGTALKEIYEAKLKWQFPESPCVVELFIPEDPGDLLEYQISFWQQVP